MRNERDMRFDPTSGAWFGKSRPVSPEEMAARVWRFGELVPSPRAFLDCTLPGHVRTLLSALGGGADDEQLEGTAVEQAVNYHIDFVKAPPGNGAALHSHGSEETFVALTGRWEIYWGDDGERLGGPRALRRHGRSRRRPPRLPQCVGHRSPTPHHTRRPQRWPMRLGKVPPARLRHGRSLSRTDFINSTIVVALAPGFRARWEILPLF